MMLTYINHARFEPYVTIITTHMNYCNNHFNNYDSIMRLHIEFILLLYVKLLYEVMSMIYESVMSIYMHTMHDLTRYTYRLCMSNVTRG